MNLTTDEFTILSTRHANSYEAAQLRNRLMVDGLHFCSICKTIKEADAFLKDARGRGGRGSSCRRCRSRNGRTRRTGFIPTGPRYAENEARRRERDPEAWREGKRKADRRHTAKKRVERLAASPHKPPVTLFKDDPDRVRAAKRKNFDKRKALGMSGRQANYMAPAPEFDESWNAIKR